MESIAFWCKTCNIDVEAIAKTRVLNDKIGKVKEARCPGCNTLLRRYSDRPDLDKYFIRSRGVKIQRRAMSKDLLQPGDPLFDLYYPEHKRKQDEQLEQKWREGQAHHDW